MPILETQEIDRCLKQREELCSRIMKSLDGLAKELGMISAHEGGSFYAYFVGLCLYYIVEDKPIHGLYGKTMLGWQVNLGMMFNEFILKDLHEFTKGSKEESMVIIGELSLKGLNKVISRTRIGAV